MFFSSSSREDEKDEEEEAQETEEKKLFCQNSEKMNMISFFVCLLVCLLDLN